MEVVLFFGDCRAGELDHLREALEELGFSPKNVVPFVTEVVADGGASAFSSVDAVLQEEVAEAMKRWLMTILDENFINLHEPPHSRATNVEQRSCSRGRSRSNGTQKKEEKKSSISSVSSEDDLLSDGLGSDTDADEPASMLFGEGRIRTSSSSSDSNARRGNGSGSRGRGSTGGSGSGSTSANASTSVSASSSTGTSTSTSIINHVLIDVSTSIDIYIYVYIYNATVSIGRNNSSRVLVS